MITEPCWITRRSGSTVTTKRALSSFSVAASIACPGALNPGHASIGSLTTDLAIVGKRLPRVDGLEKVTGRAEFVADVSLPGMLWGAVLRSPYPHARIRSLDTTRARKLGGVRAVVTAADTPGRTWGV